MFTAQLGSETFDIQEVGVVSRSVQLPAKLTVSGGGTVNVCNIGEEQCASFDFANGGLMKVATVEGGIEIDVINLGEVDPG